VSDKTIQRIKTHFLCTGVVSWKIDTALDLNEKRHRQ
jgi:hypothetical protein